MNSNKKFRRPIIKQAIVIAATAVIVGVGIATPGVIKPIEDTSNCGCSYGVCGCVQVTLPPYNPYTPLPTWGGVAVGTYQPTPNGAGGGITATPIVGPTVPSTLTPRPNEPTPIPIGIGTPVATVGLGPTGTVGPVPTISLRTPIPPTPTLPPGPLTCPVAPPGSGLTGFYIQPFPRRVGDLTTIYFSAPTPYVNVVLTTGTGNGTFINVVGSYTWSFSWTPSLAGTNTATFFANGTAIATCQFNVLPALNGTATPIPYISPTPFATVSYVTSTPGPSPTPTATPAP